ncbi:MAG: bi-domain-containing oxidoreductase [Candidatus Babeliales bacterium]
MRQIFLQKNMIAIRDVCQPLLEDDMVLVQVHYSCISPGTENATIAASKQPLWTNLHTKLQKIVQSLQANGIHGTRALVNEKLAGPTYALGYACSGVVIAVGSRVRNLRIGDMVACAGAGYAHHAEIIVVPENLVVPVHKKELLAQAAVTTLGAIALQGIRRAQLQLGESVAVLGLGLLGQLTAQMANNAGATVFGIDLLDGRLSLAKQLGTDCIINGTLQSAEQIIAAHTAHQGVDVTIITASSASNEIIQQAMRITRKKGRVVLVGDVGMQLERDPLYQKEIDFLISCSYGPGRYDVQYEKEGQDYPYAYVRWTENRNMQAVVQMIEKGTLVIDPLIQQMPLEQAAKAYQQLQKQQTLGVILTYQHEKKEEIADTSIKPARVFHTRHPNFVRVGVIGAGGFAKVMLMPILSSLKNVAINAIVDPHMGNALTSSALYRGARVLSHDQALFDEDLVDAVIIASPHRYHCAQALTALENGKAVFLEKPMVTTFEQLHLFTDYLTHHPQAPLCIDYNRSFAPYIQKIKRALDSRTSPLIMHYRMNAGFIPKDHWTQTEMGAGRIIGEACHIIDLFHMLCEAQPVAVSVEAARPYSDDITVTDNVSIQISFSDGSIGTLLYTALGHHEMGKERMELFFDSQSIVMEDFARLTGYGLPASFNEKTKIPDKGHRALIEQFFTSVIQHTPPPIAFDRLRSVAHITLVIDQLAKQGGGSAPC